MEMVLFSFCGSGIKVPFFLKLIFIEVYLIYNPVFVSAVQQKVAFKINSFKNLKKGDFPGGPVGKTLCSQGRGPGFDPWSGN